MKYEALKAQIQDYVDNKILRKDEVISINRVMFNGTKPIGDMTDAQRADYYKALYDHIQLKKNNAVH